MATKSSQTKEVVKLARQTDIVKKPKDKSAPKRSASHSSSEDAIKASSSTGYSLLKHAGQWAGDDIEELLQLVHETRSRF